MTSEANPIRVDWLASADVPLLDSAGARLGMTFLPGKHAPGLAGEHARDLDADLGRLQEVHGCEVMLLLVEDAELERFGVARLPEAAVAHGIEVLRNPISDGGAPGDRYGFRLALDDVIRRLAVGASVVVACRGGLGRTGLAVACMVRDLAGLDGPGAIALVRRRRQGAIETEAQRAFVEAWSWPDQPKGFGRPLADRLRDLADLVPILEPASLDFGSWTMPRLRGGRMMMPFYTFGPAEQTFRQALGRGGWILVFDWGRWLQTPDGQALKEGGAAVEQATPLQLARLLTAIVRSDRFVEGSLAGAFGSGLLESIARRAAVLLAELEGTTPPLTPGG